ncbi:MAG: DUF1294 domain-containing protein [Thermoproteota archaeon]
MTRLVLFNRSQESLRKRLFMISPIGGCFGVFLGMLVFHHKTRKAYFGFIVILTLMLYILVLIVLTGL